MGGGETLFWLQLIHELTGVAEQLLNSDLIQTVLNTLPKIQYWSSVINSYIIATNLNVRSLNSLFSELEVHAFGGLNNKMNQAHEHHNLALARREKEGKT